MKRPFIYKNYNGIYYVVYYVNGKRKKVTTKESNKQRAEIFKDNFIKNDLSVIEYSYIKANDYLKEWIELKADKKPSTIESYKTAFNELIRFCGNKNLNQYTLSELNRFLLSKNGFTSKKYKTVLNSAFSYAIKLRYIKVNPFIDTVNIKTVKPPVLIYKDNELKKLFEVIDNALYKDIALFGLYSGMRLNEILSIRKENIFDKLIILPTSKEDVPRVVSISNELKPIIQNRSLTSNEYLFEYRNHRLLVQTVSHIFGKYIKRAGLNPKLNFHSLRKTYGTKLIKGGVPLNIVSEMLGHSSERVTKDFYTELLKEFREEVNIIKF